MIYIQRSNAQHPDFTWLVSQLDADLAIRDGDEHAFYAPFNTLDTLKYTVVAYQQNKPVSCGAIKEFDEQVMEVKRMFTLPEVRGTGMASKVLDALEKWAAEMGYARCILETGKRQLEAIGLYLKNGYSIIPNYGQYIGVTNSVCFEKYL